MYINIHIWGVYPTLVWICVCLYNVTIFVEVLCVCVCVCVIININETVSLYCSPSLKIKFFRWTWDSMFRKEDLKEG